MIRSTLEYCGAVWDPTTQEEVNQLEMVQRRAARWSRGAKGIVSVTALLNDLGWQSLAHRRKEQRLCIFYKVLNGLLDISPGNINLHLPTDGRTLRNQHRYKIERLIGSDKNSPLWSGTVLRTIPDWNSLPARTVEADSLTAFKSRLSMTAP